MPAWIMVLLIVAIAVSSAFGIEAINHREERASRAELEVTQLRVIVMKASIIFDQFQIDPSQAQTLIT